MFQSRVSVGSCLIFVLLLFTWGVSVAGPGESPPAGLRSGTLDVGGGSIYYEVAGKGESLVLIHDGMLHRERAWDSLGEGQAAAGDIEAAIASYGKSLDLNPDNENGRGAIEQLEESQKGKAE